MLKVLDNEEVILHVPSTRPTLPYLPTHSGTYTNTNRDGFCLDHASWGLPYKALRNCTP